MSKIAVAVVRTAVAAAGTAGSHHIHITPRGLITCYVTGAVPVSTCPAWSEAGNESPVAAGVSALLGFMPYWVLGSIRFHLVSEEMPCLFAPLLYCCLGSNLGCKTKGLGLKPYLFEPCLLGC
jgi:hypothetical protein